MSGSGTEKRRSTPGSGLLVNMCFLSSVLSPGDPSDHNLYTSVNAAGESGIAVAARLRVVSSLKSRRKIETIMQQFTQSTVTKKSLDGNARIGS